MELRHLRYFVAVAKELNITRAAERLHVSQPPLSRQIRDLEEELGVVLLERSPQRVVLTPKGAVFLKDARAVLKLAEEAVQRVQSEPGGMKGDLRIGYSPNPTIELLPKALKAFRKTTPGVRTLLHDAASDELLAALLAGTMDVLLGVDPVLKPDSGATFEHLFDLPLGVFVPLHSPLASRRQISLKEALQQPLVRFARKGYPDYHHWLSGVVRQTGIRPKVAIDVDGATSMLTAVESGLGIAFAPKVAAAQGRGRVKYLPIGPEPCTIPVGFAVRKGKLSGALAAFVEVLRRFAEKQKECYASQ